MALRALQGPTGGGAPVGGTGTTNTIPRWTGPSTLGDSGLIDNGTAIYTTTRNAIGFNTAAPTANTFNFGASRFAFFDDSQTKFGDDGIIRGLAATGDTGLSYYTSKALNIRRGNTLVATFDSSGNVGIGTASPTAGTRLHVVDASAAAVVRVQTTLAGAGASLVLQGTSFAQVESTVGDFFLTNSSAAGNMIFRTGSSTERWRINSSGHFLAGADNTYDIGASGATRPRTVYVGTGVVGGYLRAGAASAGVASTTTIGNGTSTTATAGAQTLPANPLGFIIAHVGTTEVRIPYYAV